ncbi:MAG: DMT family transporter [Nocardioides sp.]|nr:DMT family transporter [Nocardioides sp.]
MSTHIVRGALAMTMVGSSVAVSHALVDSPLLTGQGLRYAAATVLLVVMARLAGVPLLRPRGREWLWLAGVAVTGLVLFNVAVVRGVDHAEPAVIAVAVAGAPVLIGLLGPLLEGRVPQARSVLAAVVVTGGSVLVTGAGVTDLAGVGWAALALLCEAAFTLLAVPVLPRHTAWGVSVHAVWIAAVLLLVSGLVLDGPGAASRLTGTDVAALAYLAVVVTAAAFVLWYGAVSGLGSGRAALLCGVAPVAAAALGIATTGIVPAPLVWVGIGVVLAGLALGLRTRPDATGRPRTPDVAAAGLT